MRHGSRRQSRGFSFLELVVAVVIICILAVALLNRLAYYQELAEKAALESMVRVIKTGLQMRLAELIISNRQREAAALEAEDPMQWLDAQPANYGGAYREPPARGTWYYDSAARHLVYVVSTGERLNVDTPEGGKQLRFQARLLKDRLRVGRGEVENVTGVTLAPLRPYRWQ